MYYTYDHEQQILFNYKSQYLSCQICSWLQINIDRNNFENSCLKASNLQSAVQQ